MYDTLYLSFLPCLNLCVYGLSQCTMVLDGCMDKVPFAFPMCLRDPERKSFLWFVVCGELAVA